MASAFVAKAVLELITTRALIERLQIDSKLGRICGFNLHRVLPSEATFSRTFTPKASAALERQRTQNMSEMLAELPQACSVGTKLNAKG